MRVSFLVFISLLSVQSFAQGKTVQLCSPQNTCLDLKPKQMKSSLDGSIFEFSGGSALRQNSQRIQETIHIARGWWNRSLNVVYIEDTQGQEHHFEL
jgi:hypothetical protein